MDTMPDLDAFIIRGHEKIIEHYRWLRDRSADQDCVVLQHRIEREMAKRDEHLARLARHQAFDDRSPASNVRSFDRRAA
jgi:hypothetical protein